MIRLWSLLIIVFMGSLSLGANANADPVSEQQKIDSLLTALDAPGLIFIRNGEEHDGAWAKQHLKDKMKEANPPIITADDFISRVASTSSHTGKPYIIKTQDGKMDEAGSWFKNKLGEPESGNGNP